MPRKKVEEALAPFMGESSQHLREALKTVLKAFGESYFQVTPEKVDEIGMDAAQLSRAEVGLSLTESVQFLLPSRPTSLRCSALRPRARLSSAPVDTRDPSFARHRLAIVRREWIGAYLVYAAMEKNKRQKKNRWRGGFL